MQSLLNVTQAEHLSSGLLKYFHHNYLKWYVNFSLSPVKSQTVFNHPSSISLWQSCMWITETLWNPKTRTRNFSFPIPLYARWWRTTRFLGIPTGKFILIPWKGWEIFIRDPGPHRWKIKHFPNRVWTLHFSSFSARFYKQTLKHCIDTEMKNYNGRLGDSRFKFVRRDQNLKIKFFSPHFRVRLQY